MAPPPFHVKWVVDGGFHIELKINLLLSNDVPVTWVAFPIPEMQT